MIPRYWPVIAGAVFLVAAFFAGYRVRGTMCELAQVRDAVAARDVVIETANEDIARVAQASASNLASRRAIADAYERGRKEAETDVQNHVYHCGGPTADGVRRINRTAAVGDQGSAERGPARGLPEPPADSGERDVRRPTALRRIRGLPL